MALTKQQQTARAGRLTGSTMAAVVGVHAFKTELQAYLEITGQAPEEEVAETKQAAMDLGLVLEKYKGDIYKKNHVAKGHHFVRHIGTITVPDLPWLAGSPDGLVLREKWSASDIRAAFADGRGKEIPIVRGWEGKTHGWLTNPMALRMLHDEWEADHPPAYHRIQCDSYQLLCGEVPWDLSGMVPGIGIKMYKIPYKAGHLKGLRELGEAWWTKHIKGNVMPDPECRDQDTIAKLYPFAGEKEIEPFDVLDDEVRELADLKHQEREIVEAIGELKAKIQQSMGQVEASKIKGEDYTILWREYEGRKTLDKAALEEDGIDIDAYKTQGKPYRQFRTYGDIFKKGGN